MSDLNNHKMEQILKALTLTFDLCIEYSDEFPGNDREHDILLDLYANVEDALNTAHTIVHGYRFQGKETLFPSDDAPSECVREEI